jgi:biopolymer transport protein ExbD
MTPVIDIVFLLIIFFLVVCQFIEAENFPVSVPDGCGFARSKADCMAPVTTVTVMRTGGEGEVRFAVGSETIAAGGGPDLIVRELARMIDAGLEGLPAGEQVVTLRVDGDVCFGEAQYALAGIAASCARDIQLAALKDRRRQE